MGDARPGFPGSNEAEILTTDLGLEYHSSPLQARADTVQIQAPKPEIDLTRYNASRAAQGRRYAVARQQALRLLTPPAMRLLGTYEAACIAIMTEGYSDKLAQELQYYEKELETHKWATATIPKETHDMLTGLRKLRYLRTLSFYGDFAGVASDELRRLAEEHLHDQPEPWRGQWTEIAEELRNDLRKEEERVPGKIPTLWTVREACRLGGLDEKATIKCVFLYVDRNDEFNNGLRDSIAGREYAEAAKAIYEGLQDLDEYLDEDKYEEGLLISSYLIRLRDQWFELDGPSPGSWVATQELRELATKLELDEASEGK